MKELIRHTDHQRWCDSGRIYIYFQWLSGTMRGNDTSESGVFEPLVKAGEDVRVGQPLANIIHPYESELIETLYAPVDGRIFFIHNDPLTYANTAVIKLVR